MLNCLNTFKMLLHLHAMIPQERKLRQLRVESNGKLLLSGGATVNIGGVTCNSLRSVHLH